MVSELKHKKIALLLMAAGSSSRLGQPKQLVLIAEKDQLPQSLLCRQVSMMNSICLTDNTKAFCVLGCQSEKLIADLASLASAENLTLIKNNNWSKGLSSSIAKGVSELDNDIDAVLIFLVDQWQLTVNDLTSLINEWRKKPEKIHIAGDGDHLSPPVIFPRSFFKELIVLSGDEGAKKVLKKNREYVNIKKMPLAFIDLDTPEQLQELNSKNS
ncbi:nucleotidyltransferase family protein [Colwellia sp. 4_MG-2023]|jgi:molybdenum cofactor cytidylyltransferase|uniref:nucleotidyltransferase family protein n=1 Tax=unclassified Colwellia TaxID=196834 RepID=UPI001C07FACB|nr:MULTISPECIES: nucleotidyltransferase family protein [unclassified Colwellia]MBU2924845.1 nucleotidyltransferase family protein [Colwellia sp. C2M11]MDO6487147.1 nucleotidyltransferase family protein [Colwellia sp. 6_MG-2023]MDO6505488.1 nucleotidyltransferase family protein [Colwellia sp. 5_MG-2023]MDO6554216.1 nucleotidyltransferase family protein [Colwellia sp. 4_MG-2023]MDO6650909.1 nucleotidyltransferase family protein [Colwellia sp. 3_MG-2023]